MLQAQKCADYFKVIKREIKRRPIYECRWDERLKAKVEGSTRLTYTGLFIVYHETMGCTGCLLLINKVRVKQKPIHECRCDERLQVKVEGTARLTYTVLYGGVEHLKIETRLIDERFTSVMGECVL